MSKRNIITELSSSRSILRGFLSARRLLIAFMLVALAVLPVAAPVTLLPVFPAAAQVSQVQKEPRVGYNAALVVPDRIEEIPNVTPEEDKFPELDNFAWRAFVALNWPALTDPAHRGMPDRDKHPADP